MDISNTLTSLPNQSSSTQAHNTYTDISALNQLKQQAREDQRSALKPVAGQFEAIFVQQILQESRKVSFDEGWLDGNQGDFYKDWSDKQLAQDLAAKGTLGFADKIVEQLAPQIPTVQQFDHKDKISQQNQMDKDSSGTVTKATMQTTEASLALRKLK